MTSPTLTYVVSEDWYFRSHRLPIALAAMRDGFHVHVITRESGVGDELRALGLDVHNFNIGRGAVDVRKHRATLTSMRSLLEAIRPDVIHNVAMKPVIYSSLAARELSSTPVTINALGGLGYVFTSTALKARALRLPVQALLRRAINANPGKLILQNDDDRELLVKNHVISPDRIRMVRGSGVDTRRFQPTATRRDTPVVAFAARFLVDKGIHEFIEATAILRAKSTRARFALIGGPDTENPNSVPDDQLRRLARQHDIELWGWSRDMATTLREVDIMVLPSYREGLPKSLIEAASSGLPIVTTDAPGCRDVVLDGVNGFRVPVRSIEPLAAAIERLVYDPDLRGKLGEAGRRRAESIYSIDDVVQRTLDIYREELTHCPPKRKS